MEQIYTIPVNEAFEKSMEDPAAGCPFCRLYNKLEQDELDLILGASMMEPDVRVKTNELGFCRDHFAMMIRRPKRLPLALVLESHLAEQNQNLGRGAMFIGKAGENAAKKFTTLAKSCYVCDRIEYNFVRMQETAALLWDQDEEFRKKPRRSPSSASLTSADLWRRPRPAWDGRRLRSSINPCPRSRASSWTNWARTSAGS